MLSIKGMLLLTMFLAGGLAATQGALNTQLSNFIGSPFQASFISFCIGTFVLGLYLIISKQNLPSLPLLREVPLHYLLGGLCGSIFITCMIFLIPRIGVVNVLFLGLAGQMVVSVAIDSFGLFGLKQQQLGAYKVLGIFIIVIGVGLLNYDAHKIKETKNTESNQLENPLSYNSKSNQSDQLTTLSIVPTGYVSDLSQRRERLRLRKQYKRSARLLLARRHSSKAT